MRFETSEWVGIVLFMRSEETSALQNYAVDSWKSSCAHHLVSLRNMFNWDIPKTWWMRFWIRSGLIPVLMPCWQLRQLLWKVLPTMAWICECAERGTIERSITLSQSAMSEWWWKKNDDHFPFFFRWNWNMCGWVQMKRCEREGKPRYYTIRRSINDRSEPLRN